MPCLPTKEDGSVRLVAVLMEYVSEECDGMTERKN